jgi:hypothetical protein
VGYYFFRREFANAYGCGGPDAQGAKSLWETFPFSLSFPEVPN